MANRCWGLGQVERAVRYTVVQPHCHWRELPQVSFLSRQIFYHVFCSDKNMLAATKRLSRQNYVCRNKIFVATNTCLSRQKFCRDKIMFVLRKVLSRQEYVCRDKRFFARSILLWRQKTCFVATNACLSQNLLSRQTHSCGSSRQ